MAKKTIGDRIRERRLEMGISQNELARRCGYSSRSTINKIENNFRNLSYDKLLQIAKVLKLSPNYLSGFNAKVSVSPELEIGTEIYNAVGELTQKEIKELIQYAKKKNFGKK